MCISRGDIFYVEYGYAVGSEQRSGRPGVIVSNNMNNEHSPVVELVYLTTKFSKRKLPTHVSVDATGIPSIALCEQIHSVDCQRLGNYCGSCSEEEMQQIDEALLISLGLWRQ